MDAIRASPQPARLVVTHRLRTPSWHGVDARGEPLVIAGLSLGTHRILIELAHATHRMIDRKAVTLKIPARAAAHLE